MNDYRNDNIIRFKKSLDTGCESGNDIEDYNTFKTWFKANKCEIGISHLNCFSIEDYVKIQESQIMKKFDKNEYEWVINHLKKKLYIRKKLIGEKLSRNRLIALMMHGKEIIQNKYIAKISKEATGN